jgi:hypothetical protein
MKDPQSHCDDIVCTNELVEGEQIESAQTASFFPWIFFRQPHLYEFSGHVMVAKL